MLTVECIQATLSVKAVMAKRMMALAKSANKLQQKVKYNKLDQRRTMGASEMPDFQQLNET